MDGFRLFLMLTILAGISACRSKKAMFTEKTVAGKSIEITALLDSLDLLLNSEETIISNAVDKPEVYQPSVRRDFKLLHTRLELLPVWESSTMIGKAQLTLIPWFYSNDSLILDAKGFEIRQVRLVSPIQQNLTFSYSDSLKMRIFLGKTFSREDTLILQIDYVAQPEQFVAGGSNAIQSDKGLFFINPSGKDPFRPRQLWTQGEPESASRWFPTLDAPNQKSTQEVWITVPDSFITLSNGKLLSSTKLENGLRMDYWKQTLPHAPYLFMIAAGRFSKLKDTWNGINLEYLIEPKYEKYAPMIFGRTPEMLSFFSEKFKTPYPWEKYTQIIVREFVSGAMENTGAVVHFELLNQDSLEYQDGNYEDIIAHELVHHWFGNLVTAESWSQICLNESFASYGEYLWKEYKYGKAVADAHIRNDLDYYINRSKHHRKSLVRHYFREAGDVFDAHSYQKGACILHYLRSVVGDEAFFESLRLYLHQNAFGSAEVSQLRLAFEAVTGQDFKVFFDQWFFSSGHPVLEMSQAWDEVSGETKISLRQVVDGGNAVPWELPLTLAVYEDIKPKLISLTLKTMDTVIRIKGNNIPKAVVIDPYRVIPGQLREKRSLEEWAFLLGHSELPVLKTQALEELAVYLTNDSIFKIIHDMAGGTEASLLLRREAMKVLEYYSGPSAQSLTLDAIQWCSDKDLQIRQRAYPLFASQFAQLTEAQRAEDSLKNSALMVLRKGLLDSSNVIRSISLEMLYGMESAEALAFARSLSNNKNLELLLMAMIILDQEDDPLLYSLIESALKTGLPQMDRFMVVNWLYNKLEMEDQITVPVSAQSAVLDWLKALMCFDPMPEIRGMAAELAVQWNGKMALQDAHLPIHLAQQLAVEKHPEIRRRLMKLIQPSEEKK